MSDTSDTPQPAAPSFAHLIQEALNAEVTPERIAARVHVHIEKAVDDAVLEAMRSWSTTGKTIKNALEAALRVNELNLPVYGHVVAQMVERQIQARVAEVVGAALTKDLEDLLSLAPKRAKLSELVATLLEGDALNEAPWRVYCEVEWNDGSESYGSAWILLGREKPRSRHEAEIRLLITLPKGPDLYKEGEAIGGTISCGHVKGSDLKKDIRFGWGTEHPKQKTEFGRWFGFEQRILAMYACGTIIEIDEHAVVTERD